MSKLVALESWKASAGDQSAFMQRVSEGEAPKAIADAQGLPHSLLMRHIKSTPVLYADYRAALETWVEALAHETVALADGVAGAEEGAQVAAAKLQVDTRFRLASKLYREMFGEDVKAPVNVNISLGDVAREIRELEARLGIGLPAAIPAPKPVEIVDAEPI